jgi:phosphoglycerate dehydrogenase-like enzyme
MSTPVLVVHDNPDRYFQNLVKHFPGCIFHTARKDDELLEQINSFQPQILFSFRCDRITTAAQIKAAQAECVQWIQVAGAGHDHLGDLSQLPATISNCGGVLSRFQAETVIGAMINLNFGFNRYQQLQKQKTYKKLPWNSLAGQKLLLVGFGNIGKAVARDAHHFGMHVTAVRSKTRETPEADAVFAIDQLPELLPYADFVSLHLPHTDKTHQFFDKKMFTAMKKGSYFINTARGQIVNEEDLIEVLINKHLAGAYLDVFSEEPLPESNPLWNLENAIITPHYCDAVSDWHERFADFFADNLQNWLHNEPLQNIVKKT